MDFLVNEVSRQDYTCLYCFQVLFMIIDHHLVFVQVSEINDECHTALTPGELASLFNDMHQQSQAPVMLPASIDADLKPLMGAFKYCKPTDDAE